jgi:hypothetical protein
MFVWDNVDRIDFDPCGCNLCKKIQKATKNRNAQEKMADWYKDQEDKDTKILYEGAFGTLLSV